MKLGYVYIMSNKRNGTLYIGVTKHPARRVWQHKEKKNTGFTSQYDLTKLVYLEACENVVAAIAREKQLKNWKRVWKLDLIESINPQWDDLYEDLWL